MTRRRGPRLAIALLAHACGDAPAPEGGETSASVDASSDGSGSVPGTADDGGDDGAPSSSSDGAPDPDGSSGGDGSEDGSESSGGEAEGIPIFVAQGMVGRTTVSYDDGLT